MKKILYLIGLMFFLQSNLSAGEYFGKYKYFKITPFMFKDEFPVQIKIVNFGFIGAKIDNEYLIIFEPKGGEITKLAYQEEKKYQENINIIDRDLEKNNLDTSLDRDEKESYKMVAFAMRNEAKKKGDGAKSTIDYYNNKEKRIGVKFTGIIKGVDVKRGDIVIAPRPLFHYYDDTRARMRLEVNTFEFNNIEKLRVKKNNIIVDKKQIKKSTDEENVIFLFLDNPSPYELNQEYKITISD